MKRSFFLYTGLYYVILPAIGLLIFTSGFFLTRVGIEVKSPNEILINSDSIEGGEISFEGFARFNRVVILLIDALRYDFVKYSSEEIYPGSDLKPYHNHMKTIHHLTSKYPDRAKLFKFIADPPTTTMQRIKGLTTGSLPTFVDQTSNFNSPCITEDTILHQIALAGRKTLFAGDDTWMDLFPDSFSEAHPYPSFNVKDLHSVDEGVVRHLFPFLERSDWSLIIGHFLGVDHCGHIYGPDHSTMRDKLIQLDNVINSVVDILSEDTLLVVMGDHGMTETGDHGGDTWNETHAALFFYSPRSIFPLDTLSDPFISSLLSDSVSQKDLVPTLSLLIGLPIPYSNLGSLIPELFLGEKSDFNTSLYFLSRALLVNCLQVWRYLEHYSLLSSDIPHNDIASLRGEMDSIVSLSRGNDTDSWVQLIQGCIGFLKRSESICQSVWAKFNINKMSFGIILMVITMCLQIYTLFQPDLPVQHYICRNVLTRITYNVMPSRCCVWDIFKKFLSFNILLPTTLITISTCSLFSNSYIIWEDTRIEFLLQTYNYILFMHSIAEWYTQSKHTNHSGVSLLIAIIKPTSLLLLMRLTRYFHVCRPEQSPCESSHLSLPLLNLAEKSLLWAVMRFSLSTISLFIPIAHIIQKYRLYYNKCYSAGLILITVLIFTFWLTRLLPESSFSVNHTSLYYTASPRIIYFISILLFAYAIWNLWRSNTSTQLREFTFHYSCISTVVWLLCCLLVGDGMVPSLAILLIYLTILSRLVSDHRSIPTLFLSHYFFLLCSKFYFAIGHQFTVQSIRYEAAFTGFHGNLDSFLIAGFLVVINMFAPYIWNVFIIPIILAESVQRAQGKMCITRTLLQILCMAHFQVSITCAVAFTHRRHLMVWNVFAPRFVYEAVTYWVLVVSIFIVFLIVYASNVSFS